MFSPLRPSTSALLIAIAWRLAPLLALGQDVADVFGPTRTRSHVERLACAEKTYTVDVGGTVDMDNTTTRRYETFDVAFQNNLSLVIANTGQTTVVNPRIITGGKRRWWCMEELLGEILEGAADDQEKAMRIWEFVRRNRHHDDPIFVDDELHDPIKMLNVFGAGLCDDSGYVGCSLLYHAGLNESKYGVNPSERTLHGHMMCEAILPGGYQFLDIDENTFYLDLENERPVSGDAIVADHYLAKREHSYGPIFKGWNIGQGAASLFGRDDGSTFRAAAGHRIEFDLRPGERIEYRWDNCGRFASDDSRGKRNRRFWGTSVWAYDPVLNERRLAADAERCDDGELVYQMVTPYAVCGGRLNAVFRSDGETERFAMSVSLDGVEWSEVWNSGGGLVASGVVIDEPLGYKTGLAKYVYYVKITSPLEAIESLRIETDLMTSPHALPRLGVGSNRVEYTDDTPDGAEAREITVTHRWRESDAVTPPTPPQRPLEPEDGATVRASTFPFRWPSVDAAASYHIRVSRSEDMRLPYRPAFDVIVDSCEHHAPFTGLFNPEETYYWRVRPCNAHGVWGAWSPVWQFTWQGPRIPVEVKAEIHDGRITLSWSPNPRGERPVRYVVHGSDERGFTPSDTPYDVVGLGRRGETVVAFTDMTSLEVVSAGAKGKGTNRAFYRVVAIDANGTASGPSALVELPHPFLYSKPGTTAQVGQPYQYEAKTLQCLGDLQHRYAAPVAAFWETEGYEFRLAEGPDWLTVDPDSGVVSGTPSEEDVGVHPVRLECHRRYPREVKPGDYRPSYFLKDAAEFQASDTQTFEVTVRSRS